MQRWMSLLAICAAVLSASGTAQTNTFPSTGNVGIGTTSPINSLDVIGGSIYVGTSDNTANASLHITAALGCCGRLTQMSTTSGGALNIMTGNNGTNWWSWGNDSAGNWRINPGTTFGSGGLTITPSGNVGIGTTSPGASLDINGVLHVTGSTSPATTEQGAYLGWNALTGETGETDLINNPGAGTGGFAFMSTPSSGSPRTTLMYINASSGKVGIGTTSPGYNLDVDGSVHSSTGVVFPDGTVQTTAYQGAAPGSGTPPLQVTSTEVVINGGVSADGSGIKHVRTNTACTPGTSAGNTCTISVDWPGTPFADANYTVTCTPKLVQGETGGETTYGYAIYIPDANKSTTSTSVVVENLTTGASIAVTGMNCIAMHD